MTAVIYCRVSTKEQTQNLSLPIQRKACEEYCRRQGWEVARLFMEEGESAKTANRTQLQAMLAYCRAHKKRVQFVVVYNLSRFSRETGAHHALRGLLAGFGIALRSATEPIDDSPTGRLMESIIASIAQFDNDVKADRTRAGMREALQSGRWTFQAPLGYRMGFRGGPSLFPETETAGLVREAFEAVGADRYRGTQLLQWLAKRGLVGRRGGRISAQSLRAMLRNPIYMGRIEVPKWGISVPGNFEAIVSPELFARVQARTSGRLNPAAAKSRVHPDFPLRGFVRCSDCERPLTGSWSKGRGARYAYYHCPGCGGVRVPRADMERDFCSLLALLEPRGEYLRLFDAIVRDVWQEQGKSARQARARLSGQIAELQRRLDDLDDALLFRKTIDQRTYERQRDLTRERMAIAEVELAELTAEELDVEGVLAFALRVLADARRLWEQADIAQKRQLQSALYPEGLIYGASGFGTAVTCLAFMQMPTVEEAISGMASPAGFEPASPP